MKAFTLFTFFTTFLLFSPMKFLHEKKKFTLGIFCLAIDHQMEEDIAAKLKNPKSKNRQAQLKSLCRIPANYIKFLAANGIDFVPIFYNNNDVDLFLDQMDDLDGLVLIGGTVYTDYRRVKKATNSTYKVLRIHGKSYNEWYGVMIKIVKKAKKMNDNGIKFLLYSVCVSFEGLVMADTNFALDLHVIRNNSIQRKIFFDGAAKYNKESKLKKFIGSKNQRLFATHKSAYFFHNFGMSLKDFVNTKEVFENYMPVATFKMGGKKKPVEFVAAYEHRRYPFFALQFHPEKVLYETTRGLTGIIKDKTSMRLNSLFSAFILSELNKGARGLEQKREKMVKYSCPRYFFKDLMIFDESYVYDCIDFLSKNLKVGLANTTDV